MQALMLWHLHYSILQAYPASKRICGCAYTYICINMRMYDYTYKCDKLKYTYSLTFIVTSLMQKLFTHLHKIDMEEERGGERDIWNSPTIHFDGVHFYRFLQIFT